MKNNKLKLLFVLFIGLFTVTVASGCSCTSSMCTTEDEANIKTQIEKQNIEEWRNSAAVSNNMIVESNEYKVYAENKVNEIYLNESLYLDSECGKNNSCTPDQLVDIKKQIKSKYNNEWLNALEEIPEGSEGYIVTRTQDFQKFVDEQVESLYQSHPKACLVIADDTDPSTGAKIEAKSWKDAWKTGLLEGLIVYPIAWLLSSLTEAFGGSGVAQLLAILVAVIIIRVVMLLMNFKGQLGAIKMQEIQPELSEINAKLKDPHLSQQEKSALSMKMMEIYRKNNINPLSTMLTQFISFPIFIAVWAAMNQTLAIRKGTLLGMNFGETINTQIFRGSITAIIVFVLMIAGQVCTMKLSMWIKIAKEKKKNPNYKKPSKNDSDKQMNMFMTIMMIMVVMSGFVLPAALVLYWFLGSVFSILQTLAFSTDFVNGKLKAFVNRKKKAKVIK